MSAAKCYARCFSDAFEDERMSRIGKKPVAIPSGVTARLDGRTLAIKGAKGELKFAAPEDVTVEVDGNAVKISPRSQSKRARAMWGMSRSTIQNLVAGVTKGFEKKLEISGVGYKAAVAGKNLQLSLGYSHDLTFPIPSGIIIVTPKPTEITIAGIDKRQVGQVAAEIRRMRPPEPYKGKGVKYANEFIFRKEGKKK
jgi:large subunit ribosomal protein L6